MDRTDETGTTKRSVPLRPTTIAWRILRLVRSVNGIGRRTISFLSAPRACTEPAGRFHRVATRGDLVSKAKQCSDRDWTWLFGVDRGTTRQGGYAAKPLVCRNKHGDMLQAVEIESNSQLQCVKCPQALNHSVLNQEFPRALKMAFVNRRCRRRRRTGPIWRTREGQAAASRWR